MSTCKSCGYPMTSEQQRVQYGRLMKKGFSEDQAKDLLPRCQKCLTQYLRQMPPEAGRS